jgi:uncharacterized protein YjbJ (UPF0337 family)
MVDVEKIKVKAEQLKGEVEKAVGKATGSLETQARDMVDEAKGKTRETVADLKSGVTKGAGEAQENLVEVGGKAKAALTGLTPTSIAITVVGVVVVLALVAAWFRATQQSSSDVSQRYWNPAP